MDTNNIKDAFNTGFKVKLQNRGPKSSGITWELKSVFDDMTQKGIIKDTDGKGLTKQDALNLYAQLNKIHENTGRATNYTRMQVGQEFDYTADEMKALAKAAGYEIVEENSETPDPVVFTKSSEPAQVNFRGEQYLPIEEIPHLEKDENGNYVDNYYDAEGNLIKSEPHEGYPNTPTAPAVDDVPKGSGEKPNGDINPESKEVGNADEAQTRKQLREELREERREERLERRQERAAARELRHSLREVEPEFKFQGQTGKILDGKYYINGKEVSEDSFKIAATKAESLSQATLKADRYTGNEQVKEQEIEPFTPDEISKMKVSVADLEYSFDENGKLNCRGEVGYSIGPNDIMDRVDAIKIYENQKTGSYEVFGQEFKSYGIATRYRSYLGTTLSLSQAVYMDLLNKQKSDSQLSEVEMNFMKKFESDLARFYSESAE